MCSRNKAPLGRVAGVLQGAQGKQWFRVPWPLVPVSPRKVRAKATISGLGGPRSICGEVLEQSRQKNMRETKSRKMKESLSSSAAINVDNGIEGIEFPSAPLEAEP